MRPHGWQSWLIAALFVLLLGLPIVGISLTGGEYSESEKRTLAPMPVFFQEDGSLNPELREEYKVWLEDHIGFREALVELAGRIRLYLFHQSPTDQVSIGKDGWMFYTRDNNLRLADGTYPITEEELDAMVRTALSLRDKLAVQGIDFVMILPPSKVSVYPEYLRGVGDGQIRETLVDEVARRLSDAGIKVIPLKQTMLDAKSDGQVFFKQDTHWTSYGEYRAYEKIIEELTAMGLCETPRTEVDFVAWEHTGEFSAMMGSVHLLKPEELPNVSIRDPQAVKDSPESPLYTQMAQLMATLSPNPCHSFENGSVQGKRVLVYGDSMFGGRNMPDLLAENFPNLGFLWSYDLDDAMLQLFQPDVVLYEITERYLISFPLRNQSFLARPLQAPSAQVLDAVWREDGSLAVTMLNTGTEEWKRMDLIRCLLWSGDEDTGLRAMLPYDVTVPPGESYTFVFEDTGDWPKDSLFTQMLQEGITYFGERVSVAP